MTILLYALPALLLAALTAAVVFRPRETADGARWMRDSFASWFSTAWLYVILWGVIAGAFVVLLYIDGKFSRGLAEGVEDIDPLSFQAMGWVYRFFAASFLMAAARCAYKGISGAKTFRWLGVFASIIVCLHAFGFGFEALDHRRDNAMAARQVAEIAETSNAEIIQQLKDQKAQIDADLERDIAPLNAEIYNLDNDGKINEDLTDRMRDRRTALQDAARERKQALDDEILRLTLEGSTVRSEGIETVANAEPWAPLFVGMAQLTTWSKEPSDWSIYLCAVTFVIFWVLLGESLVIFLPERVYVMHLKDADNAKSEKRSEAAKKGWETRKENEAASKRIEGHIYWAQRILKAVNTGVPNPSAQGIRDTYFDGGAKTIPELESMLKHYLRKGLKLPVADPRIHSRAIERGFANPDHETPLTQDHVDFILRQGPYAPPVPAVNGHDHSTNESDDDADDTESRGVPAG